MAFSRHADKLAGSRLVRQGKNNIRLSFVIQLLTGGTTKSLPTSRRIILVSLPVVGEYFA
jgi:hypothetical protein